MSPKKYKRSNIRKKILFEIYGVLLISFSILSFISLFYSQTGIIGEVIGSLLMGLCGFGAFIIPFFILMFGIGLIVKQDKLSLKLKFYAMCFTFLFFLILIEVGKSAAMSEMTFLQKIKAAYLAGMQGEGGGILGEIFTYPIIKLFGTVGAYIFSVTFIIINFLLFTNASIYKIALFAKDKLKSIFKILRSLWKKPSDNKNTKKDGHKDEELVTEEREKYIDEVNRKIRILDFFKESEISEAEDNIEVSMPDISPSEETQEDEINVAACEVKSKQPLSNELKKDEKIQDEIDLYTKDKEREYVFPPLNLLNSPTITKSNSDKKDLINGAKVLEETLESFGVEAKVMQVSRGPVITRYELHPSAGVKVSKIVNLSDDIALNLAAPAVRIEAPIPGKAAVGIEIPNKEISPVYLREVIESKEFIEADSPLTFALGKDVAGNCVTADLAKMPHLLIAGATGSGKSVCINTLITSILYKSSPEKVKLLMIDPKVVELSTYNGIPHLLIPVVTDPRKAAGALSWAIQEMTNRYKLFADNNVRNIQSYNDLMSTKNPEAVIPKIVIIIDELADLMMVAANDVEDCICRLAQMARAAGMHLVIATQRPSVDVITGVIKANIPSRISFAVSSQIDSRTILDMAGAEKLLGKGDMLYYPLGESKPLRVQGAFISEREVEKVVEFVKNQSESDYKEDIIEEIEKPDNDFDDADELLPEAIKIVIEAGQASISLLQRRMRIGYNRAARIIDGLEKRGIIGGYEGSKPRQVLITKEEYEEMK